MKIGLLAMSGIRAHDKKLLELGLTLPGVVERSQVVASLPSLGLLYLAALTPAEHEVRYFEAESDRTEPAEVYTCDLVAISTFSAQVFEAYAIADQLWRAGVKVAMGGLHVTVRPEEALEHADYIFIGEGERLWGPALEAIAEGTTQRTWNAAQVPAVDVHTLPVPHYDLLKGRPYNRFTVQTTRGCPWRCDFCASNVMLRQPYRKRPVADVIRDICAICRLRKQPHRPTPLSEPERGAEGRGGPFIEFADDNTFVDKASGKELCRCLIPLRVKWFTETDISVADDQELLELMREARCRQLLIGLESPNASALDGIELKANFKASRSAGAIEALKRIQAHGITVNGCFILGLDRHTPDVFREVLDFALEVLRRADHGADAVSRHAALRPAATRRSYPSARPLGPLYALRRELSAQEHDPRATARRALPADRTAL